MEDSNEKVFEFICFDLLIASLYYIRFPIYLKIYCLMLWMSKRLL